MYLDDFFKLFEDSPSNQKVPGIANNLDRFEQNTLLHTTSNFNEGNCSFLCVNLPPHLYYVCYLWKPYSSRQAIHFSFIAIDEKRYKWGRININILKVKNWIEARTLNIMSWHTKNVRMIFARNHIHLCAIEKHLACSSITTITLERGK